MFESILFSCTVGLSYILNKILIRFSKRIGALAGGLDHLQERWSSSSKPLVGGISFYILFLVGLLFFAGTNTSNAIALDPDFIPVLIATTLGFIVGLADDAYTTKPLLKFLGQVGVGVVLLIGGIYINLTNIYLIDASLTLFWVVGIMNSINMLDNMDGITGTVSFLLVTLTIVVLSVLNLENTINYSILSCASATLLGFLVLNWNPSKLYMGDTGSQFLGALLAYIGIKYYWNLPNLANIQSIELQFMFPALGFLIPILDTSIVTVARLRRGQSPFVGGRDHLTHHLSYLGIPDKLIPLVLGIASIVSALLVLSLLVYIPQGITGLLYISAGYVLAVSATFITLYQVGLKRKKLREQNSLNVHTDQQKKQKVAVTA